ncbi:RNA 2',3'-cyclic phosphodiesterase [Candidatus Woesearchaeota archaeon]|nr:RNA 2',3'-cyclic phosphodiesterase [Candidatus Woesearchaeota archaeon]
MRLFIAVDFNELKGYFLELQSRLPKNADFSLVKSFHMTLKFLGEVHSDNIGDVISRLNGVRYKQFGVFLGDIGFFQDGWHVKVVWVGVSPEKIVSELQKNIDESLSPLFRKEKNFKAHITLARVNHPEGKKQFLEKLKKTKVEGKKIEIGSFRLVKSDLTAEGPVYEDVAVFNSNQ